MVTADKDAVSGHGMGLGRKLSCSKREPSAPTFVFVPFRSMQIEKKNYLDLIEAPLSTGITNIRINHNSIGFPPKCVGFTSCPENK